VARLDLESDAGETESFVTETVFPDAEDDLPGLVYWAVFRREDGSQMELATVARFDS